MAQRLQSLQHEYTLFVEQEIEHYKESVSRGVLLGIGDEAVQTLATHQQLALTELILCDEVDRIIKARLRLPSYQTWRRRRLRAIKDYSRPSGGDSARMSRSFAKSRRHPMATSSLPVQRRKGRHSTSLPEGAQ